MRKTTALAACLAAVAGCHGGSTREPVADAPVAAPIASASLAEAVMSREVDVPWSIALVSDEPRPAAKRAGRVLVADVAPAPAGPTDHGVAGELEVVAEHAHADEKPAAGEKPEASKTCSGVVNRRS